MDVLHAISEFVARTLRRVAQQGGGEAEGPTNPTTTTSSTKKKKRQLSSISIPTDASGVFDDTVLLSSDSPQWQAQVALTQPPKRSVSSSVAALRSSSSFVSGLSGSGVPHTSVKARFIAMLYCAIYDGDVVIVRRMLNFLHRRSDEELALYLDTSDVVSFARTPFQVLHYAVASRSVETLQLVLFFESDIRKATTLVDVNATSAPPMSCTPLHVAIALRDFDLVRTLLASGAKARSLRGPPSCRLSALQDALQYLAEENGNELDETSNMPVEPLHTHDGITDPPRPLDPQAPWMTWVKHGEEERSKIPRGAWRVDTNSFVRSRTPSPSSPHRGGGAAQPNKDELQPKKSKAVLCEELQQRLSTTPLFRISVLLLHQGAELIFQKLDLDHRQSRRLQQVTSMVQRALHHALQHHEDTGLDAVIGQDAEQQQRQAGTGRRGERQFHQDHDEAEEDEEERQEESAPSPTRVEGCISSVIAARVRKHHALRMERLYQRLQLLTPHHHGGSSSDDDDGDRTEVPHRQQRRSKEQCIDVGSTVWIVNTSRYCPKKRDINSLHAAGKPTRLLLEASEEHRRNPKMYSEVVTGTLELLRLMKTKSSTSAAAAHSRDSRTASSASVSQAVLGGLDGDIDGLGHAAPPALTVATPATALSAATSSRGEASSTAVTATAPPPPPMSIPIITTTPGDVAVDPLPSSPLRRDLPPLREGRGGRRERNSFHVTATTGGSNGGVLSLVETSQMRRSSRGTVFSESVMVGDPNTVVGCVACIVSLPDIIAAQLADGLDRATFQSAQEYYQRQESLYRDATQDQSLLLLTASNNNESPSYPRGRLFAGIIVEPMFGTSRSGSLLSPSSIVNGGGGSGGGGGGSAFDANNTMIMSELSSGGGSAAGVLRDSYGAGLSHGSRTAGGLNRALHHTLPFCSHFVPLADLMIVEQRTSISVVEHRLRRHVNALHTAILSSSGGVASTKVSGGSKGVVSADAPTSSSSLRQVFPLLAPVMTNGEKKHMTTNAAPSKAFSKQPEGGRFDFHKDMYRLLDRRRKEREGEGESVRRTAANANNMMSSNHHR